MEDPERECGAARSTFPELRADAARNRAKVLGAARRQLEAGDLSLAMNAISKQAGVGVGTVYRHFPTRQNLLEALAVERLDTVVEGFRTAAAQDDPVVGLHQYLRLFLRSLLADPALVAALELREPAAPEMLALRGEMKELLTRLLQRAQAAGKMRPDVRPTDLRRLVIGLYYAVHHEDGDEQAAAERLLDITVRGLQADGAGTAHMIGRPMPR